MGYLFYNLLFTTRESGVGGVKIGLGNQIMWKVVTWWSGLAGMNACTVGVIAGDGVRVVSWGLMWI